MKEYLLITGAASGVGQAVIKELSAEYNLVITGRNMTKLKSIAQSCTSNVIIWEQDLAELETIEENLSTLIIEKGISINKFVHCAGAMKMVPSKMVNSEMFINVFSVNVFSVAMIIKVLTSRKINKRALDSVVLISSNVSNRGAKTFSVYGSSKAALDGLMRNLAVELAPRVRVNSVLPGGMKTEMTESIFENEEVKQRMELQYPLGIGTPKNLVGTIKLLLSNEAAWITGQQFVIDGGRSINITE